MVETALVFTAVFGFMTSRSSRDNGAGSDWPMYGGSLSRDLVNLVAKDLR